MLCKIKNKKQTKLILKYFVFILIFELLSLCVFLNPSYNNIITIILALGIFLISLKDLKYGIIIALIELFIGSKGYLFIYETGDFTLSIRIIIWLIIMSVWMKDSILALLQNHKKYIHSIIHYPNIKYFGILFIFVLWGVINGLLQNNSFNNIFFDVNGWLFFSYLFPFIQNLTKKEDLRIIFKVFFAACAWISFKTLALLYIFTHEVGYNFIIYKWVRDTGVGEITRMVEYGDFYRIFFQSHVYIIISTIAVLLLWNTNTSKLKKSDCIMYLLLLSTFMAVNIVNLSRSNWVGLIVGLTMAFAYIGLKLKWKMLFFNIIRLIIATTIGYLIILSVVTFPFPKTISNIDVASISDRASKVTNEAGVSSRWNLLPKLRDEIKDNLVLGKGFGTLVTYKSNDPRVLETSVDGEYTTFAFEWGWLDIWLKIGLFGVLTYIYLILRLFFSGFSNFNSDKSKLTVYTHIFLIGIIVFSAINMFSPYLNHPIGIGTLILASIFVANNKEK